MNVGHVTIVSASGGTHEVTRRQVSGPPHALGRGVWTALADHYGEHAGDVLLGALCECFDPDTKFDPERLGAAIAETLEVLADELKSQD